MQMNPAIAVIARQRDQNRSFEVEKQKEFFEK